MTTQPYPTFNTVNFSVGKGVRPVLEEASTFVPFILVDELTIASPAANGDFTVKIPPNTLVESLIVRTSGGITLATGTHVGVGISGDPDLFAEIAAASLNEAGETVYVGTITTTPVFRAAETTIRVASTNGSGTAAGTLAGNVQIVVSGRRYVSVVE